MKTLKGRILIKRPFHLAFAMHTQTFLLSVPFSHSPTIPLSPPLSLSFFLRLLHGCVYHLVLLPSSTSTPSLAVICRTPFPLTRTQPSTQGRRSIGPSSDPRRLTITRSLVHHLPHPPPPSPNPDRLHRRRRVVLFVYNTKPLHACKRNQDYYSRPIVPGPVGRDTTTTTKSRCCSHVQKSLSSATKIVHTPPAKC